VCQRTYVKDGDMQTHDMLTHKKHGKYFHGFRVLNKKAISSKIN